MPAIQPASASALPDVDEHLVAVRRYADEVLWPRALDTDRDGVQTGVLDEFARLGLLTALAPADHGGLGLSPIEQLHVSEALASGCLNTWLVYAQHAGNTRLLGRAAAAGQPLPPLAEQALRGEILSGTAISDIRRGRGNVVHAHAVDGGWLLDGTVSWLTGWGLDALFTVAALADDDTVLIALVEADRLHAAPLDLAAVNGSRTVRAVLRDIEVPAEHVLLTTDRNAWQAQDQQLAGGVRAHAIGTAARALRELEGIEPRGVEGEALPGFLEVWQARLADIRDRAYHEDEHATVAERLRVREQAITAAGITTQALLVAKAGRGLQRDDTAQLLARNALFLRVQGATGPIRREQLLALTEAGRDARGQDASRPAA